MLKRKILFKISGSIAAYKSAGLISQLVQDGHEVQTVVTDSALKFIGPATLEGLTGKAVMSDVFEHGNMMSHIDLAKWADLTILAPATATTINRFAQGIGEDLVSALFLAHDWQKPYFIAPGMNSNMLTHPATRASLQKLKEWGVHVLPTQAGNLACGDVGLGRMLEPESIHELITPFLDESKKRRSVLITSGGTREPIDAARFISNMSTGNTGATIADLFISRGWDVTYLVGKNAAKPQFNCALQAYDSTADLQEKLSVTLKKTHYDAVIHLAAVSDYRPVSIGENASITGITEAEKIPSTEAAVTLKLEICPKLVDGIKAWSVNKNIHVVAFKFTASPEETDRFEAVANLFQRSNVDWVIHNDAGDRQNGQQSKFRLFVGNRLEAEVETAKALSVLLEQKIAEVLA